MQLSLLRDDIASLTQIFGPSGHEDLVISGWVRVSGVGGIHAAVLAGQVLQFRSDTGELVDGYVSVDSAHLTRLHDKPAAAAIEDVFVDFLMTDAAELNQCGIAPGTPGVFAGPFAQHGDLVRAKALDDRAGIAVLLELLRSARAIPDGPGLTVLATVQEEFTLRAGFAAAGAAAPDMLLCVDISPARSVADPQPPVLGTGPVLHRYSRGRYGGGLIPNPRLAAYVTQVAASHGIPLNHRALVGGLTDASYMQFASGGIPCLDLAFAARNAHTAVEVAHLGDLGLLASLLRSVVADLPRSPGFGRG